MTYPSDRESKLACERIKATRSGSLFLLVSVMLYQMKIYFSMKSVAKMYIVGLSFLNLPQMRLSTV